LIKGKSESLKVISLLRILPYTYHHDKLQVRAEFLSDFVLLGVPFTLAKVNATFTFVNILLTFVNKNLNKGYVSQSVLLLLFTKITVFLFLTLEILNKQATSKSETFDVAELKISLV